MVYLVEGWNVIEEYAADKQAAYQILATKEEKSEIQLLTLQKSSRWPLIYRKGVILNVESALQNAKRKIQPQ